MTKKSDYKDMLQRFEEKTNVDELLKEGLIEDYEDMMAVARRFFRKRVTPKQLQVLLDYYEIGDRVTFIKIGDKKRAVVRDEKGRFKKWL